MAGAEIGSADWFSEALFESAAGVKLNYIMFAGGGEMVRELLGGHVDVAWLNPSEAVAQYEAKKFRPLAVASQKRLPEMSDVPTFKELGYDVVFDSGFRGVLAPPGIPPRLLPTM